MYCAASFCNNKRTEVPNISFFRFPKDHKRCSVWCAFVERPDLNMKTTENLYSTYRICAEHFEDAYFMNSLKNALVWNAIPTIKTVSVEQECTSENATCEPSENQILISVVNVQTPGVEDDLMTISSHETSNVSLEDSMKTIPSHETSNVSLADSMIIETSNVSLEENVYLEPSSKKKFCCKVSPSNPSPKIQRKLTAFKRHLIKYKNRFYNLKRKMDKVMKIDKKTLLQNFPGLDDFSLSFILCQLDIANKSNKHGYRYDEKIRTFASEIYFRSPNCYYMLANLFKLPSVRSLQRTSKNADHMSSGFSDTILHCGEQCTQLSSKLRKLQEEYDQQSKTVTDQSILISDLQSNRSQLQNEKDSLLRTVEQLKQQITCKDEEIKGYTKRALLELEQHQQELQKERENQLSLQAKIIQLETVIRDAKQQHEDQLASTKREAIELKDKLQQTQREISLLKENEAQRASLLTTAFKSYLVGMPKPSTTSDNISNLPREDSN